MYNEIIKKIRYLVSNGTGILTAITLILFVIAYEPVTHTFLFGSLVVLNGILWVLDFYLNDKIGKKVDRRNCMIFIIMLVICILKTY